MNIKFFGEELIDWQTKDQAYKLEKTGTYENIRIMPDAHYGAEVCVGFTAKVKDAIDPRAVGVDIGCGMLIVPMSDKFQFNPPTLDEVVREYVPSRFNVSNRASNESQYLIGQLKCFDNLRNKEHLYKSMGTLGGGNHFVEIGQDEDNNQYLIIHSGSRNLGKQIADYYTSLMENEQLLTGANKENYLHDMNIAVKWATLNREKMAHTILTKYGIQNYIADYLIKEGFTTIHNYIDINTNIIRKGAISAEKGQLVLIPFNMRDGSIIATGKGNTDWNCSGPHGAGRVLSRSKAKKELDLETFKSEMKEVYSTSVSESTLDESPMAYKDKDIILDAVKDTVHIIKYLKPIYNFKA